ncbi:MAG: hypothetical protein GX556_17530 [Fibrobacter sp.]|nr:hypothetical protein [Fibrobacter sp.]
MKNFLLKLFMFLVVLLALQAVISLDWQISPAKLASSGWCMNLFNLASVSIPDPDFYNAGPEIAFIQEHLKPHPSMGFLWKENIDTSDEVVIQWGDVPSGALSTDRFGFANVPEAIELSKTGRKVDIVGVGASFLAGAQGLFHEYFWIKDYFYYNMAQSRFTIPQFNAALLETALQLKPDWVVYELNEVSFVMIDDYENWKKSGINWFTYHCGSWCGPALKTGFPHDQLRRFARPLHGVYTSLNRKLFRPSLDLKPAQKKKLVEKTINYIKEAHAAASEAGAGFILLCIPDKGRMINGPSPKYYLFEEVIPALKGTGINIIDLREPFSKADDPRQLYFQIDNHWNRQGIYIAAKEVLSVIRNKELSLKE